MHTQTSESPPATGPHPTRTVDAQLAASVTDGAGDGVAHHARRFLIEHYTESDSCSTSRLAERLGVTASHLCHAYKSVWSETIGADLRRLRVGLAKRLLADRGLSIKQVAARVGYGKATYRAFFNAFRAETGMPPSRYRRLLRKALRERERGVRAPRGETLQARL